jgi:hypothetical protein
MINSTYNADRWDMVASYAIAPLAIGLTASCAAGTSTNLDYVLTSDAFFRGIQFLVSGATFGDTISLKIIDTLGVTGAPPGTVLLTPVSNWNIVSDQQNSITYESVVPKKIPGTFTIRIVYNSTGLLTPVSLAVNYELLNILV